jgi:uncharacterized glyoxalase superfamily protein PhnB
MTKLSMIIFYVSDQLRSRDFYANMLAKTPVLDVPGMTEFMLTENFKLGLMPEKGIAKILVPHTKDPAEGNGIPRCELYLVVDDPGEFMRRAIANGAKEISKTQPRDWGDEVGYCEDFDGNILAFAK